VPRGPAPMGFYAKDEERTPIKSIRLAADVPVAERTNLEVLRTDSATFQATTDARRNRRFRKGYRYGEGKVLAVAGGPIDKSWLIIRAAALRRGVDLKREASLQYGAPPLMFQKLQQGEADAGLNFWNFCARLETLGYRSLIDVREAEKELGLKQPVAMIGYVFSEQFAAGHRDAINRFVKIAQAANDLLRQSDGEWDALRPLIKADDEATFNIMRQRTREGMPRRSIDEEASDARLLFRTLAQIGGTELVGPAGELDAGLYYYPSAAHGE